MYIQWSLVPKGDFIGPFQQYNDLKITQTYAVPYKIHTFTHCILGLLRISCLIQIFGFLMGQSGFFNYIMKNIY